jgi:hypothetical protein
MAAAPWPDGVPYQTRVGTWQLTKPFRDPYRTQFDDGAQRARRSSSRNIASISFSIIPMTIDEFELFKAWVRDDLVDGTLPDGFLMSVFTGSTYAQRVCRMTSDPAYRAEMEDMFIVVSFTDLEVEDL